MKQPKPKEYKAMVKCPSCDKTYECKTTDENIIKNPIDCFECFMSKPKSGNKKK